MRVAVPDRRAGSSSATGSFVQWCCWATFACALGLQVFVAWKFRGLTWDDSAITLGFARTFAATGVIEPTPGSGLVEGYSSPLWMLLMAAVAKVVSSPSVLLATAKTASLALNLVSLFLLRGWLRSWLPPALATLIAGICGCSFMHYESINGMETPLLLALVLCMLLLRTGSSRIARALYLIAGVAVVLTRWESLWLLVPFILTERPVRGAVTSGTVWISTFLSGTLFRRVYFGDWVPNTVIAKSHAPYTNGSMLSQLVQHLVQVRYVFSYTIYFVTIVFLYVLGQHLLSRTSKPQQLASGLRFAALFTAFSVILSMAIGYNWGPPMRSFYTAWPFLLALILFPLAGDWNSRRVSGLLTVTISLVVLLTAVRVTRVLHELRSPYAPTYMPDATVDKVRTMADVLQTIQQATGRRDLLYAGPDVGAVMLFSNGVRIIDLALLCNRTLAHRGYGAVESYVLQQQRPDVIEVHGVWTSLTGLIQSKPFHEDYVAMLVNGRRIFVRKPLVAQISRNRLETLPFIAGTTALKTSAVQSLAPEDAVLSSSFGTYLLLKP